jgi:hypothetical protein
MQTGEHTVDNFGYRTGARTKGRITSWFGSQRVCADDAIQKIAQKALGTLAAQAVDIRKTRRIEHGMRLRCFLL